MDFFEAQDQARRNTGRLVLFFALAVIFLVVMTKRLAEVEAVAAQHPDRFERQQALMKYDLPERYQGKNERLGKGFN